MALSKKDYVVIAEILRDSLVKKPYNYNQDGINQGVETVRLGLIHYFKLDNPRFDLERFIQACEGR